MFPDDLDISSITPTTTDANAESSEHTTVGRSLKFDFEAKKFVLVDGKNVETTQIEAIKQWIRLFINTEISKYAIYDEHFGVNLDIIGRRLPASLVVAEIERTITEGILRGCPAVVSVSDWAFDKGIFSFTVKTNTGEEVRIVDDNY